MKGLFLSLLVACAATSQAATPPPVRAEIDALLGRLAGSGCRFERNGDWHEAAAARSHLLRKLEAIEGRTAVASTERFIELAATQSSSTGRAYQVQCAGAAPQPSAAWLTAQLKTLRAR